MRLLTLCPGLLANDGLCACVLLTCVPCPCMTQTAGSFRPNRVSAPNPLTLARVQPHHPSPWRRGPPRIARPNARRTHLFHHRSRLRNVGYHCALRKCVPCHLVRLHACCAHLLEPFLPAPPQRQSSPRAPGEAWSTSSVRLHASPPPNRRVMMPRGDVRLAIWLLKVGTRRVFDSDTRSLATRSGACDSDACRSVQRT